MKLLTIVLALALAAPSLGALAAPSLAFGCPGYKSGKTTCTSKTSLTGTTHTSCCRPLPLAQQSHASCRCA